MTFWTPENIRALLGGLAATWVRRPENLPTRMAAIAGVSTDSRSVRLDQAFVALKGDTFDGHDFAPQVAAAGIPLVIVEREPSPAAWPTAADTGVLKVTDTRKALLRLAAAYRRALKMTKVVAVCGSNGKTTTVRLIDAALCTKLRGGHSPKSFNNDIGVPLTLLNARPTDQYLICEVGTNAPGEIATLAAVVEPDVAVITSIGREHLEFLGSLAGVAKEESAVIAAVRTGGLSVVIADAPELRPFLRASQGGATGGLVLFGASDDADLRLTRFEQGVDDAGRAWSRFEVNGRTTFRSPLSGRHNALNALAAIAVARRLGLDDATIAAGLEHARPPEMRWETRRLGPPGSAPITIVNDAYNANPDSMLASIHTFADLYSGAPRRVVVMGDMRELGPTAPALHAEIGRAIAATGLVDRFVAVGELAAHAADALREALGPGAAGRVSTLPALGDADVKALAASLAPGDAVLLKGSRRMRLERVAAAAQAAFTPIVTADAARAAKGPAATDRGPQSGRTA